MFPKRQWEAITAEPTAYLERELLAKAIVCQKGTAFLMAESRPETDQEEGVSDLYDRH